MSLILEALRKSEAERRRGQAPDLHAELPPLAAARPRGLPVWLGVGATLLILACILWWFSEIRTPRSVTEASAPSQPIVTPATMPAVDAATFPRVERIDPAPIAGSQDAQQPTIPTEPVTRPTDPSLGALQEVHASPATRASPRDVPLPPSKAPSEPVAAAPPAAPAASPEQSPPAAQPPATGRSKAPPSIAELPAAERGQLPELKLTMHMWNERPSQRFVILDGTRYGEGDRVGAATVTRIDADGVILDLNGREVRLPLR